MRATLVRSKVGSDLKRRTKNSTKIMSASCSVDDSSSLAGGEREAAWRNESHKVSFFKLFQFADQLDVLLMFLGFCGAVGDGVAFSAMLYVLSGLIDVFGNRSLNSHEFMHEISKYALYFTYVAAFAFLACYLEAACWLWTGDRQVSRIRSKYLRAILRQDVGFFDMAGASVAEVVNSVSTDAMAIQDAIGEKIGNFTMNISGFFAGFVVSFLLVWRLAVVLVAFLPVLIIPGLLYGRTLIGLTKKMHAANLKAATIAEQALYSIRTVYSFVAEQRTLTAYSNALETTVKLGQQMGMAKGLATGANGITFAIWAFMAWYGSELVIKHGIESGRIISTGLAALMGGLSLGMSLPNLKYFAEAQIAAHRIFKMIDRVPDIDSDDTTGSVFRKVRGNLELVDVAFAYPSRLEQQIFKSLNLTIPAGKTMAIVGSSGSGKSTVIALLERYYDPSSGSILLDGIDIKNLQLRWLRTQIGLVSQEPNLFATSIKENILFGKDGASLKEVIAAAKAANAHNFILKLPNGYETQVGESGVQMSGGQKQRIAIARAMLKNPPILLLDEATSALDAESEDIVQRALEMASVGRTTVMIAHRLSSIRNADTIAVIQSGKIVQIGTHDILLQDEGGVYASLLHQQQRNNNDSSVDSHNKQTLGSFFRSSSIGKSSSFRRSWSFQSAGSYSPDRSTQTSDIRKASKAKPPSFRRLLALNKPEWKAAIWGVLGAIGFGVVQPLFAFTLGSMVSAFYEQDHDEMRQQIRKYACIFAGLSMTCFVVNHMRDYNFATMGENLTNRVRERMLGNILTFEVGWFDEDQNSSSVVCSKLASEAGVVRSLVGERISLVVQTLAAISVACVLGLLVAWRLAIIMIASQPIIIVCFYVKKGFLKSVSAASCKAQEEASKVASEAVANHCTITAFSSQDKMLKLFESQQEAPRKEARYRSFISGVGLGAAQCAMFCTWAFDFWYGGRLVSKGQITFSAMFKAFFILVSTGRMIAEAGSMTSDLAKGASTVASVFGYMDRVSQIDPDDEDAEKLEKVEGHVEIRNVDFAYPMRPDILVFKGFTMKVMAGRSMALVGKSGAGKSTIIGLIERFYDPLSGKVKVDGIDIKKVHLQTLRNHIALVAQEPPIFAGTVRSNILYGKEDATEAEMIEASKAANAHMFISSLQNGYETSTGERGVQLSGGQKQRIAIARAILKNPAILLLDEATSALDAHSEKMVQDALDHIMVGRTTIVVAHRLSTIQNANTISVLQDGAIVEQGSHYELLGKGEGGAYYELVKLQNKLH
ncbi:unnamed protein product [Sphagnum troendelagicum]